MPYNRLPRPRACSEEQLPNGSSIPDEGKLRGPNTNGVGSDLPIFQKQGHGGGRPSRSSSMAVHRDIYGGVRSPVAMDYSLSSWRAPGQW